MSTSLKSLLLLELVLKVFSACWAAAWTSAESGLLLDQPPRRGTFSAHTPQFRDDCFPAALESLFQPSQLQLPFKKLRFWLNNKNQLKKKTQKDIYHLNSKVIFQTEKDVKLFHVPISPSDQWNTHTAIIRPIFD